MLLLRPGWLARTKHQAPMDGLTEATEVYPSKNLNIRILNELLTERAAPNIRPVVGKVIRETIFEDQTLILISRTNKDSEEQRMRVERQA